MGYPSFLLNAFAKSISPPKRIEPSCSGGHKGSVTAVLGTDSEKTKRSQSEFPLTAFWTPSKRSIAMKQTAIKESQCELDYIHSCTCINGIIHNGANVTPFSMKYKFLKSFKDFSFNTSMREHLHRLPIPHASANVRDVRRQWMNWGAAYELHHLPCPCDFTMK